MMHPLTITAAVAISAGAAHAQLTLTEVFENPPEGADQTHEFIEIYGPPNFDLTGYAVVLVKGGEDQDPDDGVPDGAFNQKGSEVDEAFSLDGWRTNADGRFVIYNATSLRQTGMTGFLVELDEYEFFKPESTSNRRFSGAAAFNTLSIPTPYDPSETGYGKLENDGSSTYLLVRRRPHHALDTQGGSVYDSGYAWAKDVTPDVDYNGRLDFGDEHTLGLPIYFSDGGTGLQTTALQLEPVQVIDEVAWSNGGGKEYATPFRGNARNEFSQTPGFNPDYVARVRYLPRAPELGWTIDDATGVISRTVSADESWLYGELRNVSSSSPDYGTFKQGPRDVSDGNASDLAWLAPTDPNGRTYSYDGPGDGNPFVFPYFEETEALDPSGTLLVEPYDINGYRYTPGSFNDAPEGTPLASTDIGEQFRWVRGDFNFDLAVDCADRELIADAAAAGWTLDDQAQLLRDRNDTDPSNDSQYTGYARQLDGFNATLAMLRMDLTDGSTGEWTSGQVIDDGRIVAWGGAVTQADLGAFNAEFPGLCTPENPADVDGDGEVGVQDLLGYLRAFRAKEADMDGDGDTDVQDLLAYLRAFRGA